MKREQEKIRRASDRDADLISVKGEKGGREEKQMERWTDGQMNR